MFLLGSERRALFLIIGEEAAAADRIKIFRRKQGKTDDHMKIEY